MRAGGEPLVRGVWGSAALVLPLLAGSIAAAETTHGVRVAMPFTCSVERGRVRVLPGPEQIYEISDRNESQPFTACPAGPSRQCRTFSIHRFTLSCPGGRAPWVEVAAAAAAAHPELSPRVVLEDGRLLLGRRGPGPGMMRDCYARLTGGGPRVRVYDPVLQDECWSLTRRGAAPHIELPLGYAPLMLARAKLLPAQRPTLTHAVSTPPLPAMEPLPALPKPAPLVVADHATVVEPQPSTAARFALVASAWRTEVVPGEVVHGEAARVEEPVRIEVPAREERPFLPLSTLWLIGIAAALIGGPLAAWAVLARASRARQRSGLSATDAARSDARTVGRLKAAGLELLPVIRDRLDQLPAAMPLRQVLARELHIAAQRFATLASEQPQGAEAERRNRSRLQVVVRDLHRLGEIIAGAQSSLGGQALVPAVLPEPRDKAEAYALLGVNPDVNERILKKLVEALRQSWHPDLARDDADRRRREDRIKQINVAWDLIQGKRVEA